MVSYRFSTVRSWNDSLNMIISGFSAIRSCPASKLVAAEMKEYPGRESARLSRSSFIATRSGSMISIFFSLKSLSRPSKTAAP